MLQPQDRRLLLDALRPPPGLQLDYAIATTYSLDLMALLVMPLAFAFFDCEGDDGQPVTDPMAMLQAIRSNANRLAVFCQSGEIKVPPCEQRLFAYLEDCVHEVVAPDQKGVFHPKVWILRYSNNGERTRYRVLCASRNLTFDRSWDTLLVLEGDLRDRENAFRKNHPLGDFIAHLPKISKQPLSREVRTAVDKIQNELRRVEFEDPEGLKLVQFWPLGIPGYNQWPFENARKRFLIISPFVDSQTLLALTPTEGEGIVISRADELCKLKSQTIERLEQVLILNSAVNDAHTEADDSAETKSETNEDATLSGLHAKLYVADDGWRARLWTGSANATSQAFERNVEFLVELEGKKSQVGINAILGVPDEPSDFRGLLQEYSAVEQSTDDIWQQKFDRQALEVRLRLSRAALAAAVSASPETSERFNIDLTARDTSLCSSADVDLLCWPITCNENTFAQPMMLSHGGTVARFLNLSLDSLTPFYAFCARLKVEDKVGMCRFVLKLAMTGAPSDRRDKLLQFIIRNEQEFSRYLMMLLADPNQPEDAPVGLQELVSGKGKFSSWSGNGLFEALVRCLDRDPAKLDDIHQLLQELSQTENGRITIPKGFDAIWTPIWAARQAGGVHEA